MKLFLFTTIILFNTNTPALASSKAQLYCGSFQWSGKHADDNLWIEDNKFNPSVSDLDTKNFKKFYTKNGLQGRKNGECLCIKGTLEKPQYNSSGKKGYGFKSINGLYTCDDHKKIEI